MRLKLLTPSRVVIDREVGKVNAEGNEGAFTLLPRHQDYVTALVPGLLSFVTKEGDEEFLAVDEGILVKCRDDVLVSTRHAVTGSGLGELKRAVREEFHRLDERERMSRSALARLESDFVRRFLEIEE